MNEIIWTRWIAIIPLIGLVILVALFNFSVRTYVRCETSFVGCEAVTSRLSKILGPYSAEMNTTASTDTDEVKKVKESRGREHVALKSSARLTFVFFAMVYFIVSIIALGAAVIVLRHALSQVSRRPWALTGVALLLALAFGYYLYQNPTDYMSVFLELFKDRISTDVSGLAGLMKVINSFGFAVCLLLTLAVCAILCTPKDTRNPEGLQKLALHMKYLRLVLYIGTMMLIVGMLLIRSIYQWSLTFMVREEAALKVAESFFASLLATEGGFFTLVLAVVYLPAALIFRHRADSVEGLPEVEAEREKSLQDYNLAFSFTQSLPRVAAILAPLLVGPIGELVTRLA